MNIKDETKVEFDIDRRIIKQRMDLLEKYAPFAVAEMKKRDVSTVVARHSNFVVHPFTQPLSIPQQVEGYRPDSHAYNIEFQRNFIEGGLIGKITSSEF